MEFLRVEIDERKAPRIGDDQVEVANSEVAYVEYWALAYYADNNVWPANSNLLVTDGYLSRNVIYNYTFDTYGKVVVADGAAWPDDSIITWDASRHRWSK